MPTQPRLSQLARAVRVRHAFAATLPVLGLGLALPVAVQAQTQEWNLNIPAQPLSQALQALSEQTGVQVLYSPSDVEHVKSSALNGRYGLSASVAAMLKGTGLAYNMDGNTISLSKPSNSSALELGATNVNSTAHTPDATSEGTGTYAAQAATIFKGAKTLKEIPQSVSVITRQQMDDQGLTELEDVYAQLPGARLDGYTDQQRIMSRGFQANTQIDGVPQALQEGIYTLDPAIYDRVEMLRGPSGLYAGSAEPGGTVNLVRKRPSSKFSISGKTSYGSWDAARTELDVTGPLNDSGSLRGRAVGVLQDKDEFYDTAHNERGLIYGALEYDITSQDTINFSIASMKNKSNVFWGLPRYADGTLPGRKTYVGVDDIDNNVKITEAVIDYVHKFENEWISKATYTNRKEDYHRGSAFALDFPDKTTNLVTSRATYYDQELKHEAYDLNLSGPFELFKKTHQAVIGYNSAEIKNYRPTWTSRSFSSAEIFENRDWGGFGPSNNDGMRSNTKQSGLYGSLNFKVLDPLSLIIGGRTTEYAYKSRSSYSAPWIDGQKESGEFTPYAAFVLDINENVSLYTSYAEIFVPQTSTSYNGTKLQPRTGEQYEIGIKSTFLDEKLNASFAIYQLRDQNRAVLDRDANHICPENFNSLCYSAAGLIQSRGFEAEISGTPTAGLNISTSWAYNQTKVLRDTNNATIGTNPDSYRVPRHLIKIWTNYNFSETNNPGKLAGWNVGGGLFAQSELYDDYYRQGSYAIFSATIGYKINKNLRVDTSIENIFDRVYLRELGSDTYYNFYGDPRNYKLTLSYTY